MFLKASPQIFERAAELRQNLTHSELMLWGYLKRRPLGYKFRRQHPVSIYIADFYCHALKLIIEIDGEIHADSEVSQRDKVRQENLEEEGIRFLRFTDKDVEKRLEVVISAIEQFLRSN
ncbi:MAG TPA: endonuclease domain-containing protein [Candidatus Babeliaceae bacterium]|nr:endonuclease domain-containing protein [Candidatus Babeliaceae bacterium]